MAVGGSNVIGIQVAIVCHLFFFFVRGQKDWGVGQKAVTV